VTAYTPKLDRLITAYAKHLDKNIEDIRNPRQPAIASFARIAFRTATQGDRLLTKIYDHLSWKKLGADPSERMEALADLALKNGNIAAAESLRYSLAFVDYIAEKAEAPLPENASPLQVIGAAKKLKLG